MYKYYKEVNTVEHFCFASEICDSLGVYSNNNKPHIRFFTYFYDGYCKTVGINEDKLYYQTRNGLIRVFPNLSAIASFAICIKSELRRNNDSSRLTIEINDKSFNILVDVKKFKYTFKELIGVEP